MVILAYIFSESCLGHLRQWISLVDSLVKRNSFIISTMGIVGLWEVSKWLHVFSVRQWKWYSHFPSLFQYRHLNLLQNGFHSVPLRWVKQSNEGIRNAEISSWVLIWGADFMQSRMSSTKTHFLEQLAPWCASALLQHWQPVCMVSFKEERSRYFSANCVTSLLFIKARLFTRTFPRRSTIFVLFYISDSHSHSLDVIHNNESLCGRSYIIISNLWSLFGCLEGMLFFYQG